MWLSDNWHDYEVIDTSSGEKVERWGDVILVRPDPQVIWQTDKKHPAWKNWQGYYHRSAKGGGSWDSHGMPEIWTVSYQLPLASQLTFRLQPFSFKHTGLFPEQAANWDWFTKLLQSNTEERFSVSIKPDTAEPSPVLPKVLNLFAYTGGATLAAAAAGAHVTHVDASKGMVTWAKENAAASGLSDAPIRWLVDDCVKFVEREIRRGNKYDAIIMDPPSYGRGPKGETWKIEDNVFQLIQRTSLLLSDTPRFFLISSYTTGLQPGVLRQMLELVFGEKVSGRNTEERFSVSIKPDTAEPSPVFPIEADELGLPVTSGGILPCGASGRVTF